MCKYVVCAFVCGAYGIDRLARKNCLGILRLAKGSKSLQAIPDSEGFDEKVCQLNLVLNLLGRLDDDLNRGSGLNLCLNG